MSREIDSLSVSDRASNKAATVPTVITSRQTQGRFPFLGSTQRAGKLANKMAEISTSAMRTIHTKPVLSAPLEGSRLEGGGLSPRRARRIVAWMTVWNSMDPV